MGLELQLSNIKGMSFEEAFRQVNPRTIQHANEIVAAARRDIGILDKHFLTADFPLYTVEDGDAILYLARRENNAIFNNIEEALRQLTETRNYRPTIKEIESAKNAKGTLRVKISDLRTMEDYPGSDYSSFDIPSSNPSRRELAERIFGDDSIMEMLQLLSKEPRVYLVGPDYIKKNVGPNGAISRACVLQPGMRVRRGYLYYFLANQSHIEHNEKVLQNLAKMDIEPVEKYVRGVPKFLKSGIF